ncbi:MAG: hypothetical protein ACRD2N_11010 [Vicinamibacterales bacterium]
MTIRVVLGRILASGTIVVAATAFLYLVGPPSTAVYADVLMPLARSAPILMDLGAGTSARRGTVRVNGGTFDYVLGHSRLPVDDVLDRYRRRLALGTTAGRASSTIPLHVSGKDVGVVAGVSLGRLDRPEALADRLATAASSRRLVDLAEFHVIAAYKQDGTVFIDFTPAPTVRLDTLIPTGSDDSPGEDVSGVHRPPGLQRLMTIEHADSSDTSRTLVYRSHDARASVADFRRALAAAGWTANGAVTAVDVGHFTDGKRELFLGGEGTAVVLVYRSILPTRRSS